MSTPRFRARRWLIRWHHHQAIARTDVEAHLHAAQAAPHHGIPLTITRVSGPEASDLAPQATITEDHETYLPISRQAIIMGCDQGTVRRNIARLAIRPFVSAGIKAARTGDHPAAARAARYAWWCAKRAGAYARDYKGIENIRPPFPNHQENSPLNDIALLVARFPKPAVHSF